VADNIGDRMSFAGSWRTLNYDARAVFRFETADDLNLIIIKREGKEERVGPSIGARLTASATGSRV
jgi:hypothetical protein